MRWKFITDFSYQTFLLDSNKRGLTRFALSIDTDTFTFTFLSFFFFFFLTNESRRTHRLYYSFPTFFSESGGGGGGMYPSYAGNLHARLVLQTRVSSSISTRSILAMCVWNGFLRCIWKPSNPSCESCEFADNEFDEIRELEISILKIDVSLGRETSFPPTELSTWILN